MYKLIAQGGILDANDLAQYEDYFDEGDKGLLELDLRLPVSQSIAQGLENKLREAGVQDVRVTTASPMLRIYFRKGFPWLAVIAAAVLGLIALAILIVGWRLYKDVSPDIPGGGTTLFWLAVIFAGVAAVVYFRRKRR